MTVCVSPYIGCFHGPIKNDFPIKKLPTRSHNGQLALGKNYGNKKN